MKTTTRRQVREAFKAIGYSASFKRNPFNENLCTIAFKNGEMLKPFDTNSSTVMGAETFEKYKEPLQLVNSFRGFWLEDTEQKIK